MSTKTTGLLLFLTVAACSDGSSPAMKAGAASSSGSGSGSIGPSSGASSSGSGSGSGASGNGSGASASGGSGGTGPGSSTGGGPSSSGASSSGDGSGSGSGATSTSSSSGSTGGSSGGIKVDAGSGDSGSSSGVVSGADPYLGPFKILVLSENCCGGYHHDSIPQAHQMLRELGQCIDAASCAKTNDEYISSAKVNSSFTITVAGAPTSCAACTSTATCTEAAGSCDGNISSGVNEFTDANLKQYGMIYFASPTGDDFGTGGAADTAAQKAGQLAIQNFIQGGGGYAGNHSATDFSQMNGFPFYTNEMTGSQFHVHNNDGTAGTVNIQPNFTTHPVVKGLPANWATQDEWYCLRKDIQSLGIFQVLATLSTDVPIPGSCTVPNPRPVVWVREFPAMDAAGLMKGRTFYTIQGHNKLRYGEANFRKLIHQGVLWATHRLEQ